MARTISGETFTLGQTYDSVGRLEKTVYPTGFQTKNVYNAFGYLKEVRRADSGRNDVYWQADRYDASGRIDGEFYGNGTVNDRIYSAATGRLLGAAVGRGIETGPPYSIQYLTYTLDQMGNVNTRHDAVTGREERFYTTTPGDGYDGLDRLKVHTVVGGGTVTVSYDAMGNITAKSDVGTYSYGANAGPHAVTGVSGGPLGPQSYTYDANGNMTGGGGRTITWTSFNQVETLVQGSFTSTFSFGANHERVKQVSHLGTTVYAGGVWERFTDGGGVQEKNYVMAPTGRVAVVSFGAGVPVQGQTRYFHTDGLGSITAVSDEAGRVVKRFAFDAWGKRLDPATGNTITGTTSAGYTRGFTDHEQLDDFGLVHMNGRVYDPVLGRFLSADPFVDGVTDSQGYNRYSYLGNNPLGGTDPSGYFSLKDVVKIGAVVAAAYFTAGYALYLSGGVTGVAAGTTATFGNALAALAGTGGYGVTLGGAIAAGAGAGFASGFAGSLINGGSIGDAFKAGVVGSAIGAVTGGLTYGIGGSNMNYFERAAAHGVVSGAAESAGGGQFRHGFYAGFATAAASPGISMAPKQARFIAAATVGGTASALGGGKFANGAVSGAFQYLLNHAQHNRVEETNALRFDGSDGTTLVLRSNTEMGNLGQYWSDSDMNGPSSGRVRVLDVDLYSGTPDEVIHAAKLDGLKFDNIVLERHNGPNGEGNLRMKRLFAPNSPLLSALARQLTPGGRVWFNGCFGQQFFDSHPDYAAGLKATFGGARVYAAPGYQAMFRYGLASQAVAPDGKLITHRFYDYKEY